MKIILPILLLISSGFLIVSTAQQSRFDRATFLLEQSEFNEAVELYSSIADNGYESGALWLNMGIAYTHLDSLGTAKYYFLQAQRYPETRTLAQEALTYVNERFNRRSAVLPKLPWDRFFEWLSQSAGLNFLFISAFIFLYAGVASILISWLRPGLKKPLKFSGIGLIVICALFFGCALYMDYLDSRYGTGVMVERQTSVYEQPRTDAPSVSTAHEGYTMTVDYYEGEEQPGWHYVRLENGMYGWLEEENIMVF